MGLISSLLIVPALSALLLALVPFSGKLASIVGKSSSLIVLAIALTILYQFQTTSADFQFVEKAAWIAEFGINYEVGIDGISLFLVLLTAIAGVCVVFTSRDHDRIRGYLSLFLFLQLSLLGVFVTLDLILFYVFFELMLVPSYLLINGWGGPARAKAAVRFVLFTAVGSVLMLSSIIYLGWLNADQVGDPSFSIITLSQSLRLEPTTEALLFLGFFIAFAIKTPIVPFHTWVPTTYGEAPYGVTAFMSAVMAKAGLYGFLRFVWPLFPGTLSSGLAELVSKFFSKFLNKLGLSGLHGYLQDFFAGVSVDLTSIFVWIVTIGVIYTALIAWAQRDAKRLLAYSSISHLGICAIGIIVCSTISVSAAVFFMFSHGIVALGLFLTLDALVSRGASSEIVELGGIANKLPCLCLMFFIFLLGSVALPLTANFVAEFSILLATFAKYPLQSAVAGLSIILGAIYMLSLFRRSMFGKSERGPAAPDLTFKELAILGSLAVLVIFLGVFPQTMLQRIEPTAKRLEGFVFDSINSERQQFNLDRKEFFPDSKQDSDEIVSNQGLIVRSSMVLASGDPRPKEKI